MKYLEPKIKEFMPDFNEVARTEEDGEIFCIDWDIVRVETELLDDLGEYKIRDGFPVILTHKYLNARHRNVVLHHEIGHFILHPATAAKYSDSVIKRKIEKEANFVAAVALIPRYVMDSKTLAEIKDEFNIPLKIILYRKYILDTYGI